MKHGEHLSGDAVRNEYAVRISPALVILSILGMVILCLQESTGQELRRDWFSRLFVVDGHTHDAVPRNGSQPAQAEMKRLVAAGLDGIVVSFPLNNTRPENVLEQIRKDRVFMDQYAREKDIHLAFTDIFALPGGGSGGQSLQVLSSVEYFDRLFDDRLERIGQLKSMGISSLTLIDNDANTLSEKSEGQLKLNPFGRKVVKELNRCGIVIDISHLPDELQTDVATLSSQPAGDSLECAANCIFQSQPPR